MFPTPASDARLKFNREVVRPRSEKLPEIVRDAADKHSINYRFKPHICIIVLIVDDNAAECLVV